MVIYSVTVTVDEAIKEDWVRYMKEQHIPEVIATGCFTGYRFTRVIGTSEEKENSFNVQYFLDSMKEMHRYQVHFAPALQKDHSQKYGDKALAFRTLLEEI
ncbi:DUF4286 family protein [bacterium]|nr:DUF4286 family protein [bacterium]